MALSTRERFWRIIDEYRQLFVILLVLDIALLVLTLFAVALGRAGTTSPESSTITVVNVVLLGGTALLIAYVLRRASR